MYQPSKISLSLYQPIAHEHRNGFVNGHICQVTNEVFVENHDGFSILPPNTLVLPYVRGKEADIQRSLMEHDPLQPLSLLFFSSAGLDGDAAKGFTRALRREFLGWSTRLIIFESVWTAGQRIKALQALGKISLDEPELYVDGDGTVLYPRIEPMYTISDAVSIDTGRPWKIDNGHVVQTSLPQQHDDDVIVRVNRVGPRHGDLWTFVGNVNARNVVGISSGTVTSHVLSHKSSLADVDPQAFENDLGPPLLAATLAALTLGPLVCSTPENLNGITAMIVEEDITLREQLQDICVRLGMDAIAVAALSPQVLEVRYDKKPLFILSGSTDPSLWAILRGILHPGGSIVLWNHPDDGVAAITANRPWHLGSALRYAVTHQHSHSVSYTPALSIIERIPQAASSAQALFDAEKSYVLVGGIGRLGLQVALWMYEVRFLTYCETLFYDCNMGV